MTPIGSSQQTKNLESVRREKSSSERRLLISGFEPFGGEAVNPTSDLLADTKWLVAGLPEWDVFTHVLPVSFRASFDHLVARMNDIRPTAVVALGQAGGREKITVERVAINCIHADIPDNEGVRLTDQSIVPGAPDGLFTRLPASKMVEAANRAGVPAEISNTAGTFVCNDLMYRLIFHHQGQKDVLCGFIHLPYLPSQTMAKNPAPASMPLDEMKRGLLAMLNALP